MTKVYVAADTGPSGFGVASRGVIREILKSDDISLTVKTHFWGLNREGLHFQNRPFPDKRFQEELLDSGRVNDDYLIEDAREISEREDVNLTRNLDSNTTAKPGECLIRDFEGQEDVWLTIGGPSFAEQAPEEPYTILSTDYNLDIVPRKWEFYLDCVDEVWVPSEWTRQSILRRIPGAKDKVYTFPYGINIRHEPTEYDCEVCLHNKKQQLDPRSMRCLRDGKFNFLVVSRFYHMKGLYRTLKAFIEEFRPDEGDNARIVIKTTSNQQFQFNPGGFAQSVLNELGYPDSTTGEIAPITDTLETQYLYDLMGHCDAFVQASRAECFGIAQLQAAWCGTPVIYTDWSAQKEVLDDSVDGFIPIQDYELERPRQECRGLAFQTSAEYPPDSKWALPSVDAIRKRMREIYQNSPSGEDGRKYVSQNYNWSDRIQPRIDRLLEVGQ